MSPALPAPRSAPSPGLELPGFFPGSGILREVTAGTEQARATQRDSEQGSGPGLYKGPPPLQTFLICTLPGHLLNIDKFLRSRALQENVWPWLSLLAPAPPPVRKPYGTSRTSRVQPSKTPQVGARPTSERVRTAAPMQRAGRDPHLQVDEDGRHVHRAEHQPQGRHVVLQERSPHCTTAWSRRGGGGLTASQGQASTDGLSVGWPLSLAHSRLCASQRAWAFWGDPRVTLRGKPSVGPGGFWPGNQCEHWTPTPPRWAQLHREPLARGAGLQPQGNQGGLCCRCLRRLGKMRFPWDVRGIAQGYM